MNIQEAIRAVTARENLSLDQTTAVFTSIMQGEASDAQIAALLVALRMKGETVDEIAGAAAVMRQKAHRITIADTTHLIDTCGTGGDGSHTFNISTAAAFVASGAGVRVAKHGNRGITSSCGSADVLEALGVTITAEPQLMQECLASTGICFMFAPAFHAAMKYAIGPRKQIGIRTIFNVLGPLTNPAGAPNQLLGVFSPDLTEPLARVLAQLGSTRAYVVHGMDGMDEITLCENTRISVLENGRVHTMTITPEEFGFSRTTPAELSGGKAERNAAIIGSVLSGEPGPCRECTILNAGFAIAASGRVQTPEQGFELARESIDSGSAAEKLRLLIARTSP